MNAPPDPMNPWSSSSRPKPPEPVPLVLYTRQGCHLCEEMKAEIARAELGERCSLREVDVDSDPRLVERFGRSVPVLEIAGRVALKVRWTSRELARELDRALSEGRRA